MRWTLAALILVISACGKNQSNVPQSDSVTAAGYHDVVYKSGLPVYRIIAFPTATDVVFYHYFLKPDMSSGTFSVDRATVNISSGSTMTLTYHDSDCKADGDTDTLVYSYQDDYEFVFTMSSTGSKEYDAFTTAVPLKKVVQYGIESYSYSPTCQ